MSSSVADLASKMDRAGKGIARANREGVGEAVKAGVAVANAVLVSEGVSRLSGLGNARLGSFGKVLGFTNPVGIIAYRGPAHLVNNGTEPHAIYPRGLRVTRNGKTSRMNSGKYLRAGRRGGSAQGLAFPDGNVRLYANHPGTRGKHFHESKVEPIVIRQSDRIIKSATRTHLARVFTGI